MKYDELFTHKDIYYYVLLSIMTIAKLPHTQRLHFSHLSVCGLLFAASPTKWRDYNLSNKAEGAANTNNMRVENSMMSAYTECSPDCRVM